MADTGLLLIRVVFGLSFAGFGMQTLFGVLGGDGLSGTAEFYESVGLRPARPLAVLAGLGELAGGLLFALGLLTPLAGIIMAAIMVVAIVTVNAKEGYWSSGAYQYCVAIIAAAVGVGLIGPGEFSLDAAIGLWPRF